MRCTWSTGTTRSSTSPTWSSLTGRTWGSTSPTRCWTGYVCSPVIAFQTLSQNILVKRMCMTGVSMWSRAFSETWSQLLHLFLLSFMPHHRAAQQTLRKAMSEPFCIHELRDAHDWLELLWLTLSSLPPREHGQFCRLDFRCFRFNKNSIWRISLT